MKLAGALCSMLGMHGQSIQAPHNNRMPLQDTITQLHCSPWWPVCQSAPCARSEHHGMLRRLGSHQLPAYASLRGNKELIEQCGQMKQQPITSYLSAMSVASHGCPT